MESDNEGIESKGDKGVLGYKMKKKLAVAMFFIFGSVVGNAYTKKEIIRSDLTKIGASRDIINSTIKIDYDLRDSPQFINDEKALEAQKKDLEDLLSKNNKNYVVLGKLINLYLVGSKKDLNKAKKYLDEFVKYNPYEYDQLLLTYRYYDAMNNTKKKKEYYEKVKARYGDSFMLKILDASQEKDEKKKQKILENVLNVLSDKKIRDMYRMSDEEYRGLKLTYYLSKSMMDSDKKEYAKAVSDYINNILGEKVSNEMLDYNFQREMVLFFSILGINDKLEDKTLMKENYKILDVSPIAKKVRAKMKEDNKFLEEFLK